MSLFSIVFEPAPKIAYRIIDGTAIIVHPIENRIITLNETGSAIWSRLDGRPLEQILTDLEALFEVDRETLKADAAAFIEEMESKDLISRRKKEVTR